MPTAPAIRALVSDLDDTLLTEHHQMTDRTVSTLKRLLRQGVKVVLASGRSAASMRPMVHAVGTPYPYIAYNGAQVIDARTDQVLYSTEIPLDLARRMFAWLEARGIYAQLYAGDDWFYQKSCRLADEYGISTGIVGIEVGKPLSAFISAPTPKVLAVDTPERIAALIPEARAAFGDALSVTTSKPYFMEVTSPLATKGNAVRWLADRIGLDPETTVCAGDSLNDLSMLEWSHLPVSVENARDEVKKAAWRVAADGRRDGLAALLDELIPEV